ncbi:hypothetical protein [Marinobacter sp. MIT932201]|uniref:hypothetical protein n=1 Tax=Marinobacter sp. MIT932201 TaxID=3096995 RepID=UPI00399A4B54
MTGRLMWNDRKQTQLDAILLYPGVTHKKLSKHKYLVSYSNRRWHLWPRSGRYQHVSQDGTASEIFMGELKEFYHRYITEELQLPRNFGKTWSQEDENLLYDMIEYSCTVRQMAEELKRHPVSVATKLAKYLDDENLVNRLSEEMFDVPVKELLGRQ